MSKLRINNENLDLPLSKYFCLHDAVFYPLAIMSEIDNSPTGAAASNLFTMATKILDPIKEKYGALSIITWYRCDKLNKLFHKSGNQMYGTGLAVDIKVPGVCNFELAEFASGLPDAGDVVLEHTRKSVPKMGWVYICYGQGGTYKYTSIERARAVEIYNKLEESSDVLRGPLRTRKKAKDTVLYIPGFHKFE